MIIGISGKAGSGKDLAGELIKELCYNKQWEIKKYADKLKDMICLLIGCTREQLEDREFKETPLGPEWTKYRLTKTFDPRDDFGTFTELTFCNKDKALDYLKFKGYNTNKEIIPFYEVKELPLLTPRSLMQILGTDLIRNYIHENTWINATFAEYKEQKWDNWIREEELEIFAKLANKSLQEYILDKKYKLIKEKVYRSTEFDRYPNWIITDVRFPNEVKAIEERGGIVIRLERFCYDSAEDFCICHPNPKVVKEGVKIVTNNNLTKEQFFTEINQLAEANGYVPLNKQPISETALDSWVKTTNDIIRQVDHEAMEFIRNSDNVNPKLYTSNSLTDAGHEVYNNYYERRFNELSDNSFQYIIYNQTNDREYLKKELQKILEKEIAMS